MKFLLQEVNGRLVYDFAYRLLDGIEVTRNMHNVDITVAYCETVPSDGFYKDFTPIGSLEFVYAFLAQHHEIEPSEIIPVNIPLELHTPEFLLREVELTTEPHRIGSFVKSATKYKGIATIFDGTPLPKDMYLMSDYIDMVAEFRVFVMQGMILDVRRYCGDMFVLPSERSLKEMIHSYKSAPPSYTLDVAVTANGDTVVIEVHPFVSCGLYGFTQEHYLPYMAHQGFTWLKAQALALKSSE